MNLYEIAVVFQGKKKNSSKDDSLWAKKPQILLFDRILARDEQEAGIFAARAIPEEYTEELDRVSIAVRPF